MQLYIHIPYNEEVYEFLVETDPLTILRVSYMYSHTSPPLPVDFSLPWEVEERLLKHLRELRTPK